MAMVLLILGIAGLLLWPGEDLSLGEILQRGIVTVAVVTLAIMAMVILWIIGASVLLLGLRYLA